MGFNFVSHLERKDTYKSYFQWFCMQSQSTAHLVLQFCIAILITRHPIESLQEWSLFQLSLGKTLVHH